jgi:hypothetical protein
MNNRHVTSQMSPTVKIALCLAAAVPVLVLALPLLSADHGGPRAEAPRATTVDRSSHGSIRHADTQVVQRPVAVRSEPVRPEPARPVAVDRRVAPAHDFQVHRDVDADVRRRHSWDDFAFGRRLTGLPAGFFSLQVGGVPYYYSDGIYYQPYDGGYQEVYPPVGADIAEPPDGSIEIDVGGQTYYYAGGAFYVPDANGIYDLVAAPIGAIVPELPPGAVQTVLNGVVAYQCNGVYYEPVFVNGVTQYETVAP